MPTQDQPLPSPVVTLPTPELMVGGSDSALRTPHSALKWVILLLPLAYLWFRLIDNLRVEWTTNPQYGYGWLVPILCLGLIVRRWQAFVERGQNSEVSSQISTLNPQRSTVNLLPFAFFAFLYLPTRLIEAATPEWRPIQWLLGIEAVGLTLCAIWLGKGRGWLRQLAFPIAFFFVAVPWPTLIEAPIIQALTRISAVIVIEVMGWAGVPAIPHGNVIEVGTGMVGIDEACSGIRSFQSSLMISLFLGELYQLSRFRRLQLILIGFALSMTFNVCRMSLLTLVAAKKGVGAISQYHDPAGVSITIACTLALWGIAALLKSSKFKVQSSKPKVAVQDSEANRQKSVISGQGSVVRGRQKTLNSELSTFNFQLSTFQRVAFALIAWLVVVEIGVQLWYRGLESHIRTGLGWTVSFPADNPTFKVLPIADKTRNLLRFDEGQQGGWTESDGTKWQAFYFSWLPDRVAGYLAKRHTPEICMQATGQRMSWGPELTLITINGLELPVRNYVFETEGGPIHVFHCRWENGVDGSAYMQQESARFNLIRGIWAGRGNKGQKILEIIIGGVDDRGQARAALVRQLEKLIKVEESGVRGR